MKSIKKQSDLEQLTNPIHKTVVSELFSLVEHMYDGNDGYTYDPANDGWIVYFEEGDDLLKEKWPEVGFHNEGQHGIYFDIWGGSPGWEAVEYKNGLYSVFMLMNNQFGMNYFIPNEEWVDPILRRTLYAYVNNIEDYSKTYRENLQGLSSDNKEKITI